MLLKSVHIKHYKSLDDVEVTLHPRVTVFVGPNAAGKSNFVDSLRFLRDAASDNLDHAVAKREGIARIRQTSKSKPFKVSFRLDVDLDFEAYPAETGSYDLTLKSQAQGNYEVEREEATNGYVVNTRDDKGQPIALLMDASFKRNGKGDVFIDAEKIEDFVGTDQLAVGRPAGLQFFPHSAGGGFGRYMAGWKFSALYPNTLKHPATPDKDTSLREDGSNWASVLRALKKTKEGRLSLERISEMMRVVLPGFLEVSVKSVGSYLVPRFKFSTKNKAEIREFDPVQLSDGTLRIFGILLSLYQLPAPQLLVIEEPEQTVHPGVLAMLAEAFNEAAEVTQIIVTTHSPHLIDHFAPDQVRVVFMHDGLTKISEIKQPQREAVKQGLMSLSEFMSAEGLQPQST